MAAAVIAGLAAFHWGWFIERLRSCVMLLDAGGLALFAVSGALKALGFGASPVTAVLLGMLTGIGGGMVRDVLVAEVPAVLRGDVYAVAALAGAAVVVVGRLLQFPSAVLAIAGATLCFGLRLMAIRRGSQLPSLAGASGPEVQRRQDGRDGPFPAGPVGVPRTSRCSAPPSGPAQFEWLGEMCPRPRTILSDGGGTH